MKFYCIYKKEDDRSRLLKKAVKKRGLDFIKLDPSTYDYSTKISFSKNDLLYRISTSQKGADLEQFLMNKNVTTFYKNYPRSLSYISNILQYEKEGIRRPKTIYRLTKDKKLLSKYGKILGFPLIIKAIGGSHGIGIMKIDSLTSLFSVADYILSKNSLSSFVLKEFIDVRSSARLIVLGNKVIDSIEYTAPKRDFRSNEGVTPNAAIKKFSSLVEKLAIKAAQITGVEFAGVDILIDNQDKIYLAETNFPCFFPRAQMLTGTNISEMMVDYLIKKSQGKK